MAAPAEKIDDAGVPLSPGAQEAKEVMQRQLLRTMASKMYATAQEEERARRVKAMKESSPADDEDQVKKKAFEDLMRVQEDIVRAVNVMKAKADAEFEQAQRVTEMKKDKVHAELVRRASAKEVDKQADEERSRRMEEEKEFDSDKQKVYSKLVNVQEDLLKTLRKMQAEEDTKREQQRRATEEKKHTMQEQLIKSVGKKTAAVEMEKEKKRRTESVSDELECQRIESIAFKMIDVQKELLSTQKQAQAIEGTISRELLEETKEYVQEQIRRKAAQKEAVSQMDEEKKRRIADSPNHKMSDAQADVVEAITRKASVKKAKALQDETQKEYVQADVKARAQENTVRKVNQKMAAKAMDEEQSSRVQEGAGKDPPKISEGMKKEITDHTQK